MVVGAKVCELTDCFLQFVCGLYVGILTYPLMLQDACPARHNILRYEYCRHYNMYKHLVLISSLPDNG